MSDLQSTWWQDFFRNGPWEWVQLPGYPDEVTARDVSFIVEALRLEPGARVLDVPCGEGRHSVELARRGYAPTGLDFNPNALAVARRRAAEKGVQATFLEADARSFVLPERFDAAICYYGSFGYFGDDENLAFAKGVREALRPGGAFLIDTPVVETVLPRFQQRNWWQSGTKDDVLIAESRRFDVLTGRIEGTFTFAGRAGIRTAPFSLRLYTVKELQELLRAAGFSRFRAWETGTDKELTVGASRLGLVAEVAG